MWYNNNKKVVIENEENHTGISRIGKRCGLCGL